MNKERVRANVSQERGGGQMRRRLDKERGEGKKRNDGGGGRTKRREENERSRGERSFERVSSKPWSSKPVGGWNSYWGR